MQIRAPRGRVRRGWGRGISRLPLLLSPPPPPPSALCAATPPPTPTPLPPLPHPRPEAKSNKIFPEFCLGPPQDAPSGGGGNQDRRGPAHSDPPFLPRQARRLCGRIHPKTGSRSRVGYRGWPAGRPPPFTPSALPPPLFPSPYTRRLPCAGWERHGGARP